MGNGLDEWGGRKKMVDGVELVVVLAVLEVAEVKEVVVK